MGVSDDGRDSYGLLARLEEQEEERRSLAALLAASCLERSSAVATRLLDRFGGTGDIFAASDDALHATIPDEPDALSQLNLVRSTLKQTLRTRIKARPLASDEQALVEYLTFTMAYAATESFRVLFLDARNCLLRDEVIASGCVREVVVHPREIMRRALEVGATALILVHNHPSGDPTPSPADIKTTHRVAAAAQVMDLNLHDHLIIARSGYVSLKRLGHVA